MKKFNPYLPLLALSLIAVGCGKNAKVKTAASLQEPAGPNLKLAGCQPTTVLGTAPANWKSIELAKLADAKKTGTYTLTEFTVYKAKLGKDENVSSFESNFKVTTDANGEPQVAATQTCSKVTDEALNASMVMLPTSFLAKDLSSLKLVRVGFKNDGQKAVTESKVDAKNLTDLKTSTTEKKNRYEGKKGRYITEIFTDQKNSIEMRELIVESDDAKTPLRLVTARYTYQEAEVKSEETCHDTIPETLVNEHWVQLKDLKDILANAKLELTDIDLFEKVTSLNTDEDVAGISITLDGTSDSNIKSRKVTQSLACQQIKSSNPLSFSVEAPINVSSDQTIKGTVKFTQDDVAKSLLDTKVEWVAAIAPNNTLSSAITDTNVKIWSQPKPADGKAKKIAIEVTISSTDANKNARESHQIYSYDIIPNAANVTK